MSTAGGSSSQEVFAAVKSSYEVPLTMMEVQVGYK